MDMIGWVVRGAVGDDVDRSPAQRAAMLFSRSTVRQLLILVPTVFSAAVVPIAGATPDAPGLFLALAALLASATLVVVLAPRLMRYRGAPAALWLLDIAVIGAMRVSGPEGGALGMLVVLPAMWLALDYRGRGVAATVLGTLGFVSLPDIVVNGGATPFVWATGVNIPLVATLCAVTAVGTASAWREQTRRLEDALREVTRNRALTEAIVTTANVGLVALDRKGRYQLVNPTQREILNQAFPDGHGGRAGLPGLIFGPDRVTALELDQRPSHRAMRGEAVTDQMCWVGADPQHQRALSISARPILDADGAVDGAVLVYMDVTELVRALKVKEAFVAAVSHELRTPLTSILGYLEMVLDDAEGLEPHARQHLDVVHRNAERLLALVQDLLLTAQLDRGVALAREEIDLSALVHQALLDHAPRAAARRLELGHEVEARIVASADPVRLRQVLDNLMTNACRYTDPGGAVVVRLRAVGKEIVLEVADTGIGIAADELPRVFTAFYRSPSAVDEVVQGLGLGLAITRQLVRGHGGRIEVESELGRGTTFRVRLPVRAHDGVAHAA